MKTSDNLLIVATLLCFSNSFGQVYKFDKLVKSEFSTPHFPNQDRTNLFNSQDYSYHLQIYNQNDSLKSRIFDTKRLQVHHFYIDNTDSLQLKYLRTVALTFTTTNLTFEFSDVTKVKDSSEITFNILKKGKRRIAKYDFTIQQTNENFFPIFKLSTFETLLFTEIVTPINFLVLKAKGRNTNGVSMTYALSSMEDIAFSVIIPQKK